MLVEPLRFLVGVSDAQLSSKLSVTEWFSFESVV